MGHASYATSPRNAMREMEDNNMQNIGMREDKEKKTYEPYTSWERSYSDHDISMQWWGPDQKGAHNERLQFNPVITE